MPNPQQKVEILLIEDDPQDAFLVEELLAETDLDAQIVWVATLEEAQEHLPEFRGCVLLDLNLPDAQGPDLLHHVLNTADDAVVVVLTGLNDEHQGVNAVAAGAQDYLVKGHVDGELLARSLRYSVERQRADESARRLHEADIRANENMRLERGLLPQVLMLGSPLKHDTFYRPGRERAIVGGDFYDAVHRGGTTHLLIGDVSGHGPDEAALGVSLRIAWRTLVMADVEERSIIPTLEKILLSERPHEEMYATLCQVSVDVNGGVARVRLLGHPPPLVLIDRDEKAIAELDAPASPPLGALAEDGIPGPAPEVAEHRLDPGSTLLLYTDGLLDAYDDGPERLGQDGLCRLLTKIRAAEPSMDNLPPLLVDEAEHHNGGPLQDDVAMLLVTYEGTP